MAFVVRAFYGDIEEKGMKEHFYELVNSTSSLTPEQKRFAVSSEKIPGRMCSVRPRMRQREGRSI